MLRDRLVCGVNDERVQRRLLSERETRLDFKRALELANMMESADKNSRELQSRASAGTQPQSQKEVYQVTSAGGCWRCGKQHHKPGFKTARCHNCGKVGHVCRKAAEGRPPRAVKTVPGQQESSEQSPLNQIQSLAERRSQPIIVEVELDGQPLSMELDTGAAVTLISSKTDRTLFPDKPLQQSTAALSTYSGAPLKVLGQRDVEVVVEGQKATLPLVVVEGEGPSLFGRDWLQTIRLDWRAVFLVQRQRLAEILEENGEVFQPGLGTLKGYQAKIVVDPDARPRFCRARTVPYGLRHAVELEMERLEKEGIVAPVQFADWAAPIVPVIKSDGKSVRICGDFKLTVNQASKSDRYPIPCINDLFATLAGGTSFTKLDMSQAYQQIELDEDSQKYTIINTQRGLYCYKRLPFGIASAPGIFQRVMESLLKGIPGVTVYLDDVLITGATEAKHMNALEEVLRRMRRAGLRLRREKCVLMTSSVGTSGIVLTQKAYTQCRRKLRPYRTLLHRPTFPS